MRSGWCWFVVAISCFVGGCHSSSGGVHHDGGAGTDLASADLAVDADLAGVDLAGADLTQADLLGTVCVPPTSLSRGVAWVRANAPFVTALNVSMGAPTTAAVNDYYDTFHATATHLWATGLPTEAAGWSAAGHAGFRYVSWVMADGTSASNGMLLGGAAPLPGRIGYQISDEPPDMPTLMTLLATAHTVRMTDPDALTIINVADGTSIDPLRPVALASADVDIISFDHYTYSKKAYPSMAKVRTDALAAGKPYWRYASAYYDPSSSPNTTATDMRWDAFVGAVFGFSGTTWFIYDIEPTNPGLAPIIFQTKGDFAATKTDFYTTAANLNAELVLLGKTTALLRSVDVRYVSAIAFLNPGLPEWAKGAGNDPYLDKIGPAAGAFVDLDVGFFRDDCDEPYVILQNAAHPGAEFPNSSDQPSTFHLEFDFSSSTDSTLDTSALLGLDLATGSSKAIALSGTGTTRTVDLSIAAGDVVVWKYKNARPIVRQP
jgi:hypothetical protein